MFGKKIDTSMIVYSSKISLKMSCLKACNNDIDQATKLYDFIMSDLETIPDTDPIPLSGFDKVKKGVDDILWWIDSNQNRILQGLDMIRGLSSNKVIPNVPSFPDKV